MATRKQTITLGIAVAIAILAMFVPILIAVPLFVLAALLIAWGLQPRRTEEIYRASAVRQQLHPQGIG